MPTSEPSSKKIRLVTALLLLVTFATGTVTGGALVHAFSPERPGMHARMQWDALDLTGAQRDKADAILEKHRPKLDAIFNDTAPKVKEVIEQVDREIREILTPEQRSRFDRMRAERRNRFVPGFGARHFPGEGPVGFFRGPPGAARSGPGVPPCMPIGASTVPSAISSSAPESSGR